MKEKERQVLHMIGMVGQEEHRMTWMELRTTMKVPKERKVLHRMKKVLAVLHMIWKVGRVLRTTRMARQRELHTTWKVQKVLRKTKMVGQALHRTSKARQVLHKTKMVPRLQRMRILARELHKMKREQLGRRTMKKEAPAWELRSWTKAPTWVVRICLRAGRELRNSARGAKTSGVHSWRREVHHSSAMAGQDVALRSWKRDGDDAASWAEEVHTIPLGGLAAVRS